MQSSIHSDDEYGSNFLRNTLQFGTYSSNAAPRAALLQWCYSSRNFGANPTMTAGNVTSADDDRMQVDSLKKGKEKGKGKSKSHYEKGHCPTSMTNTSSADINTCKKCGRHGHWAKDCWNPSGEEHDNFTSHSNPQKGKGHRKGTGKGKHVDVVESAQPSGTHSVASFANTGHHWRTLVHFKRGSVDHGCDNRFRVNRKTSWCRVFASWQWGTLSRLSNHVSRIKDTFA